MHFTTLASTATSLPSAVPSAKVLLINRNDHKFIDVPFGKLTHVDYQIMRLEFAGVTPDGQKVDPTKVTCQMYKDQFGIESGSTDFSSKNAAYISTNNVDLGWILCYVEVAKP
ncbi:hypothetical protein FZEAL_3087 [Fusarium zealandicum]|uniref:Uncharacterized protein n=1 Tax=Fusarium zealandicum TaxID=1053134 RepID=A0A8H4UQ00_9HYPO|nr:hypothetical protein FZEAL_3087 [Fusarium zealandicum]